MEEALELARALAPPLSPQPVPVPETAGRVLAEDVHAGRDLPAHASSAMDGWAVRASDTPGVLRVAGESAAGLPSRVVLGPGCAVAVSTGAFLPEGADAVARREIVDVGGTTVAVAEAVAPGADVRRRGETIREGDGLAMSSRNVRLTPEGRAKAPVLYAAITRAAQDIRVGHADRMAIREAAETMREAGFERVEYIELRDAETLMPSDDPRRPRRMLAAAWVDGVRLIDNIPV